MIRNSLIRAALVTAALGVGAPALASPIADLMPKLAKGGALPFKALTELKDAQGKVYKPTDLIVAANGKKVTAAEYLKQLNQVKKLLNGAGHKLRSGRPLITGALKIDQGTGARRKAIAAAHALPFQATRSFADRMARFHQRVAAIQNPKLAQDAKFRAAFPKFVKHLGSAGK